MENRETAAIEKAAKKIDTDAHLFFLDENDSCAIQYTSDSKEITTRFFSAFPIKEKTTNRIISSRLRKIGLPAIGQIRIVTSGNIAVICYERRLNRQYGYRNQAYALEKFFARNIHILKALTKSEGLKRL